MTIRPLRDRLSDLRIPQGRAKRPGVCVPDTAKVKPLGFAAPAQGRLCCAHGLLVKAANDPIAQTELPTRSRS